MQLSVLSEQAVTMRDGTVLYADVHPLAGPGPFPALRFDRNLNTGGINAAETNREVAFNTIFHDALRMSRIILPIVD